MSLSTRCISCAHTPARAYAKGGQVCACACHPAAPVHSAYGPTPVQRQPSKATGQMCPLVIRRAS